ncbi:Cytochrome bo(3) ubiquinol oxidase subunit 4 [Buchnera aphidicola (Chaitophorus sp. 3695)]|uniref:cytochrome o ubiquinol oxidase subunit IV n=1 Tax=Buchnera aphidicola TaxID=9 RepID=UPI003464DBE3
MILNIKKKSFFKTSIFFYILVFILSLILSIFPFYIVIYNIFSKNYLYFFITLCCFIQVLMHILFFLHLDDFNKNYWNFFSIIFTLTIVSIILTGSIWIMRNINHYAICF